MSAEAIARTPTTERAATSTAVAGGIALSLAAAALTILARPPYSLSLLGLVSFVPMIVAQHHVLPRRLAGIALAIGISGPAWYGLSTALPRGATPGVRLFPFVLGALLVGVGVADRVLMERSRYRYFVFALPLVWTAITLPLAYGPTGTIGVGVNGLHRLPILLQPVAIVGTLGLALAVYLANWALSAVVLSFLGHPEFPRRRGLRIAVTSGLVTAAWVVASVALMDDGGQTIRVAAIQPGPEYDSPHQSADPLPTLIAGTRKAASRGAELVVWPETALTFDPAEHERGRSMIQRVARETGTHVVVGYGVFTRGRARNEALLVTPDGELHGPYAKQHPVTFLGERSESDHGYPVFATPLGKVGMLICFDLDFLDSPRTMARNGAGLLAVPSNDWSEIAGVHHPGFVLRAIENRISIVKADTAWNSAIIDPYGRVVAQRVDPDGSGAVLVSSVPVGAGRTPASRVGDANGVFAAIAAVIVLGLVVVTGQRPTRAS